MKKLVMLLALIHGIEPPQYSALDLLGVPPEYQTAQSLSWRSGQVRLLLIAKPLDAVPDMPLKPRTLFKLLLQRES